MCRVIQIKNSACPFESPAYAKPIKLKTLISQSNYANRCNDAHTPWIFTRVYN